MLFQQTSQPRFQIQLRHPDISNASSLSFCKLWRVLETAEVIHPNSNILDRQSRLIRAPEVSFTKLHVHTYFNPASRSTNLHAHAFYLVSDYISTRIQGTSAFLFEADHHCPSPLPRAILHRCTTHHPFSSSLRPSPCPLSSLPRFWRQGRSCRPVRCRGRGRCSSMGGRRCGLRMWPDARRACSRPCRGFSLKGSPLCGCRRQRKAVSPPAHPT